MRDSQPPPPTDPFDTGWHGEVGQAEPPDYPWWVRVLAVAHVISRVFGPLGYIFLTGMAAFRWVQVRQFDEKVVELGVAGLACPVLCAAFRRRFEIYGRSRWPEGTPGPPTEARRADDPEPFRRDS